MAGAIALAEYCRRIGHDAELRPDVETLTALHRRHPAAIAFENIATLTGRPVSLEPADVEAKLVAGRRGGYCFEHNRLFAAVLEQCGFDVRCLAARVVWNREDAPALPRTHMLLRVETPAGPRLADVGFGGLTLTAPLEFEPGVEQPAGDTVFRLVETGEAYELQARVGERFKPMYRFDLQPQLPADFEMMNHYVATHPGSHFRTTLIAARATESGRFALADNRFTHYRPDGTTEQRLAGSVAELHALLVDIFGIEVELDAELEDALSRCLA